MDKNQSNVLNMLTLVAKETMALTKENSVMGAPVQKDGVTVIPVSKVTVGFAGGGADLLDGGRNKRKIPVGGGAKVTLTPMSFLVIEGGEARLISLDASEKSPAADVIDLVLAQLKKIKKEKKNQKKE
jgi:uncharacterized spore protein YtfJ